MSGQDGAASILGLRLRATRLDAAGAPVIGANNQVVTEAFVKVTWTEEFETGDDIVVKNAQGVPCVTKKVKDSLKRITPTIEICSPNPEEQEIIAGGTVLTAAGSSTTVGTGGSTSGGSTIPLAAVVPPGAYVVDTAGNQETVIIVSVTGSSAPFTANLSAVTTHSHTAGAAVTGSPLSVGYKAPAIGIDPVPYGCSLEVWSEADIAGQPATSLPYFYWLFPRIYMRHDGTRNIESGALATAFTGLGYGNPGWVGAGSGGSATAPIGPAHALVTAGYVCDTPYLQLRTASLPAVTGGYAPVVQ